MVFAQRQAREITFTEKLFSNVEYTFNSDIDNVDIDKGVYFVQVTDGERRSVRKLIVE
jgi:hypothetical protein